MKVYLVGVGMGNPETLTIQGERAIRESRMLVGAPRMLEAFAGWGKEQKALVAAEEIGTYLRGLAEGPAAVLLSGDVGFYSGAKGLYAQLEGLEVETICGISSLQYLCARLHTPWEDVSAASAHGRACDPVAMVLNRPRVFFLTGGTASPRSLCRELTQAGLGEVRVTVGSRLSYPDEELTRGTAAELAEREFPPLSVMLAENSDTFRREWATGGIGDEEFCRGEVPMTKWEVRAAALAKLKAAPGDTLWDVGAGTGSVAVELALLARQGRVYAVEKEPRAWELIEENSRRFGTRNLRLVKGKAPEALGELPAPDGIFVGGSGGSLGEVLALALEKNPRVRVVISAITLETLTQGMAELTRLGYGRVEVSQITCARAKALGGYHMMMGQNPVYLLSGEGQG